MRILRHITGIATCILLFAAYPKAHAQTNADARIGNALNGGDPFGHIIHPSISLPRTA